MSQGHRASNGTALRQIRAQAMTRWHSARRQAMEDRWHIPWWLWCWVVGVLLLAGVLYICGPRGL